MKNKDVIMSALDNCNKMRSSMVKEGTPNLVAYQQIDRVERFCLTELQSAAEGKGVGALIPNTDVLDKAVQGL